MPTTVLVLIGLLGLACLAGLVSWFKNQSKKLPAAWRFVDEAGRTLAYVEPKGYRPDGRVELTPFVPPYGNWGNDPEVVRTLNNLKAAEFREWDEEGKLQRVR